MLITTTHTIPGYNIKNMLGVVSANQVLGNNLISENIAAFTDVFGGKSGQYRGKLDELVDDVKAQVADKAEALGANAIVGYSVMTNQISSKGMSMFMVTATGTAVYAEQIDDEFGSITQRHQVYRLLNDLNCYRENGIIDEDTFLTERSAIMSCFSTYVEKSLLKAIEKKKQQELEAERIELERQKAVELRKQRLAERESLLGEIDTSKTCLYGYWVDQVVELKETGDCGTISGFTKSGKFICTFNNKEGVYDISEISGLS